MPSAEVEAGRAGSRARPARPRAPGCPCRPRRRPARARRACTCARARSRARPGGGSRRGSRAGRSRRCARAAGPRPSPGSACTSRRRLRRSRRGPRSSSSSSTISPSGSSSSPRITMAVPGRTPSSASRRPTERRPATSTVRPCGCRCTRMRVDVGVARGPGTASSGRRARLDTARERPYTSEVTPPTGARCTTMAEKKAKTAEKGGDAVRKQLCPSCGAESRVVQYAGAGPRGFFWVCEKPLRLHTRTR